MVGVPGKYKGCETCRRRRVKCTNERPFCQKCISTGRDCEGYERERVFITGTLETRGRVASHPKKGTSSKKQRPPAAPEPSRPPVLVSSQPLTSAWDDHTVVSSQNVEYSVLITALYTKLENILRAEGSDDGSSEFGISIPQYAPVDFQFAPVEEDFHVNAQCLARLPGTEEGDDVESYCVFLFDHNLSIVPWESRSEQASTVRRLGAANFSSFPNHHYLVRIYRPLLTSIALLSRRSTFLSAPEWMRVPWSQHPKSIFDQLLDISLQLPSIFARTDLLKPLEATLGLRFRAQELLHECLALERQFNGWLRLASHGTTQMPLAYWSEELTSPGGLIPFSNSYAFRDGVTGLAFLYYWMSQILFHRCIESLHRTIFQPVIDAYPIVWPDLPPNLQIDVTHYQHGREYAADICRGLDATLDSTVQPDMLVAPMTVAMDFYKEINSMSQDGLMEIIWLENFRIRLAEKGQHISGVLQKQKWVEIARF